YRGCTRIFIPAGDYHFDGVGFDVYGNIELYGGGPFSTNLHFPGTMTGEVFRKYNDKANDHANAQYAWFHDFRILCGYDSIAPALAVSYNGNHGFRIQSDIRITRVHVWYMGGDAFNGRVEAPNNADFAIIEYCFAGQNRGHGLYLPYPQEAVDNGRFM